MSSRSFSALCSSLTLFLTLMLEPAGAFSQTNPPSDPPASAANSIAMPSFEVATIRPAPGGIAGFATYPGGRMQCAFCTLDMLLHSAFDMQPYQIVGSPDWSHHEGFSIVAMPPDSSQSRKLNPSSPTYALNDEQRLMVQSLLIERFQLKFHREKKEGPVYVLVRGGGQLKLEPAKDVSLSPSAWIREDVLQGQNITMPQFAIHLSRFLEQPVLDETGLTGSFDFKCEYSGGQSQDYNDFAASILRTVDGIGLKLKSAKGQVETIVIDHVERPSPN